jgi:hypothetical protein
MENVGIFYDHGEYLTPIWYTGPLGIVCVHFVYFSRFGMFGPRKIWQPCSVYRQNGVSTFLAKEIDQKLSFRGKLVRNLRPD